MYCTQQLSVMTFFELVWVSGEDHLSLFPILKSRGSDRILGELRDCRVGDHDKDTLENLWHSRLIRHNVSSLYCSL